MYSRNKIFQAYHREKNQTKKNNLLNHYKQYRNLITLLCRQSKDSYYKSYFSTNLNNSKLIWKGINNILGVNQSSKNSIKSLKINNSICNDPQNIANTLNNHFCTVADKVRSKIPNSFKHFSDFLDNPNPNTFFLSPTDPGEVLSYINSLNLEKSSGPNSISNKILILLKFEIAVHLSKLINLSFSSGVFPDLLKIAKVIALFKKGSPLDCSNYRPISLLSNVEKIFEKIIFKRLYNFIKHNNILFFRQFGFRKSFSTSHALMSITQLISNALDQGNFACALFIDLEKAFDTVDHIILLRKLSHYGIRGHSLELFSSYLSNRKQIVSLSGISSCSNIIKHGVPQGSVLGPLLFLIYINDLFHAIKFGEVHHFADDTNLLHVNKNLKHLQKACQSDIKRLCYWLNANKISMNTSKTEYIIFKPRRKSTHNFNFKLKINGKRINSSVMIKYLGISLDSDLSWRSHINLINSKLKRANAILSKLRHYVTRNTLRQVYFALFHSHLSYCCQIWGQATSSLVNTILTLQKQALRIITFSHPHSHANPLFSQLKILKFPDYVHLHNVLFLKKITLNTLPFSVIKTFGIDFSVNYGTRGYSNGLISVPSVQTVSYGLNSIRFQSIRSWNKFIQHFNLSFLELSSNALRIKLTDFFLQSYTQQ